MREKYKILDGLTFGGEEMRAEAGEERDDLPTESVEWLLAAGHIERVEPKPAPVRATKRAIKK
jgi:hypothetical protein